MNPGAPSNWRAVGGATLALASCALIAVGLLTAIEGLTRERIAAARNEAQAAALAIVLPATLHDNNLRADRIDVVAPHWLGSDTALPVWRARRDGQPAALVLQAIAADGYAGPIELLIGIDPHGAITGVRVTAHQETPGLGDAIESGRSDWSDGFNHRALGAPPAARWTVRRDGGDFDQFAGATVSPRAVVRAVARALALVARHADLLYHAEPGAELRLADRPDSNDPIPHAIAPATMRRQ